MSSARRLLFVAALALAITSSGARQDSSVSVLTLSPNSDSLITGRDDPVSPGSATIGSAATATKAPATKAPVTWTPVTTPPSTSEFDMSASASDSDSDEQEATDTPSGASATVGPNTSDRSTEDQTATTKASTSASKSTASVDTLNDSNGTLTSGNSSGFSMGVGIPAIMGALACVGAIVMAVTYKKKRDADVNDNQRLSSECEYTGGASFTPDNRALNTVIEEDTPSHSSSRQCSADFTSASGSIADFTQNNSSDSVSSPFGSHRCKARVSSPVPSCFSISEVTTEFQDSGVRDAQGSNVVLTIEEVAASGSSQGAPQVQL